MINLRNLKVTLFCFILSASIFSVTNEAHAYSTPPGELSVGIVYYCDDALNQGIQELMDALIDDGRFSEVTAVNGTFVNPTSEDLKTDFDCVLSWVNDGEDCRNGFDPEPLLNEASESLAGYVNIGGSLVLGAFSYSEGGTFSFGPALFAPGLSPFERIAFGNGMAGPVDVAGAASSPSACRRMFSGVGPFFIGSNNMVGLSPGASLCASYDNSELFLSINSAGNMIGLNGYPASEPILDQDSYRQFISNVMFEACSFGQPRSIPTLSEWGLLATAIVLGAIGLYAVRRRNFTAKG